MFVCSSLISKNPFGIVSTEYDRSKSICAPCLAHQMSQYFKFHLTRVYNSHLRSKIHLLIFRSLDIVFMCQEYQKKAYHLQFLKIFSKGKKESQTSIHSKTGTLSTLSDAFLLTLFDGEISFMTASYKDQCPCTLLRLYLETNCSWLNPAMDN